MLSPGEALPGGDRLLESVQKIPSCEWWGKGRRIKLEYGRWKGLGLPVCRSAHIAPIANPPLSIYPYEVNDGEHRMVAHSRSP
jgi:hypothetical protein